MVRTAVLNSFPRRILRFGTPSRPGAPGAFYAVLWQLPQPDFHRQADDDFKAHRQAPRCHVLAHSSLLVLSLDARAGEG
jgi:hypothetical protein